MEKIINFGEDLKTSYTQTFSELKKLMPFLFDLNGNLNLKAFENFVKEYKEIEPSKFEFTWSGKEKAQKLAFEEYKEGTLEVDGKRGKNFHNTGNIIIEGENLQVLHLLRKSYKGKIKCIYIDPPYNTGNDFVYNDKFELDIKTYLIESGQVDGETGEKLVDYITKDDGKKHSKWLSFMYPRLLLARDLLTEDGVIFISIDDNEQANLKLLMTEIFGEENFVSQFVYRRRKTQANLTKYIAPVHEYVFAFAKNLDALKINKVPLTQDYIDKTYKNPDNDRRGVWQTKPLARPENTSNQKYELKLPNGRKITAKWSMSKETFQKYLDENLVVIPNDGEGMPRLKIFLKDMEGMIPNSLLIDVATNEEGSKEIENLFGTNAVFDTPKPINLIKHLLKISTKPGDIVLDFFAGSGTTGQAVMELNFEEVQKASTPSPLGGEGWGEGLFPLNSNKEEYKSHKFYPSYIKAFARELRKNQTEAEKLFWNAVRGRNLEDKFRRQFAIDAKYIADFVCLEKRLIVEIDGGQHSENEEDKIRTFYLKEHNFRVIRFWNNEVLTNLEGCIESLIEELKTPHPIPLPQGEEGNLTQNSVGGRKFILVQLPEKIDPKKEAFKAGFKFISDITIERVLRASEKYKGIDNGFKVFKLLANPKYDEYDIEAILKKVDSFILNLIAINYGYGLNYKYKSLSFGKFYEITSEFEERKALVILEDTLLSNEMIAQLIKLSEEGSYTLFAKESCLNIEIIYNLCNYFKKENIIRV